MENAREAVLVAVHRVPEPLLADIARACAQAQALCISWSGDDHLPSMSQAASLLIAGLAPGEREIPEDIVRLITRAIPGLPLLLLCGEPLTRPSVSLQSGRVTLLGPPFSRSKIHCRLRVLLADRGAPAESIVATPARPVVACERQRAHWWIAALDTCGAAEVLKRAANTDPGSTREGAANADPRSPWEETAKVSPRSIWANINPRRTLDWGTHANPRRTLDWTASTDLQPPSEREANPDSRRTRERAANADPRRTLDWAASTDLQSTWEGEANAEPQPASKPRAPVQFYQSTAKGLTVVLPAAIGGPLPGAERVVDAVRRSEPDGEKEASLLELLGPGAGLVHLSPSAREWLFYWPVAGWPLLIASPTRLPPRFDLHATIDRLESRILRIGAAPGDLVLGATGSPPAAVADSLWDAMADGGPALLDLFAQTLRNEPASMSAVAVEVR